MTVATAGMTHRDRMPRYRLVVALLAISVVLNLCVIAGAVWSQIHLPPRLPAFSERFHHLADTLGLAPEQRVAFDRYVADMAARIDRMHKEIAPMMDAVWGEIAKPDADQAQVMRLLDAAGGRRRAYMHDALGATMSLLATLTPDQRAKFLAEEREFRAALRRRHAAEAR